MGGTTQTFAYDNADRLTTVQQNNQNVMSMTYGSNGNILSKTGVGSYDYNSSKPHAVAAVDNTSGLIPEGTQSVTYNLWGKVSEVNAVVGSDTYRYELTYGPDLQRVLAVLWKNDQLVHLVTYGHDFEEKYLGSHITRYYYVSGTDGNAAVYTSDTSTGDKAYCMDRDHIGSIIGLYDQYGTKCYGASFDPWGKRSLTSSSIEFDRGFTGHEHIDEINLIDMNGRIYDPLLARFLSVDPFVQAPTNPQNYNRYSYCLNNPLKYTDPDGEYWHLIIGGMIGGITNWITHDCEFSWKGFWYFNVGALAGAASAAVGGGVSSSLAGGSFWAGAAGTSSAMTAGGSFLNGVAIGGSSGFTSGFMAGTGNSIISGEKISRALSNGWKEGVIEGSIAAFGGGLLGGINATRKGKRFWDGATVEKHIVDQSAFVTPSGQSGLRDCGPECVEIVDRSFGGNITSEDIRRQLGGDINENALGDYTTWKKYAKISDHKFFAESSKTGRPSHIFSQMKDGWRVAVNLNTSYINPSTGLREGHSVVIQKVTQKNNNTFKWNNTQ